MMTRFYADTRAFARRSITLSTCAAAAILLAVRPPAGCAQPMPPPPQSDAPLRLRTGAGNLTTFRAGSQLDTVYAAIAATGARLGRMNSYGWRTPEGVTNVHDADRAMEQAHARGVTPVFLFEYDGSYQFLKPPVMIGSYRDWFAVGAAYAARFRPGGQWGQEHGVRDWGVTVFAAINEPDAAATIPQRAYHDALAGLADGVHSVDRSLRVMPGGFATCNSATDPTLRGYGPAIADLLNDGRLDGIDLHTYYDVRFFPIGAGHQFSAQACFDKVKRASGVTRDVNFYATEFNIAKVDANGAPLSDPAAAELFLTAFWDEMGVVGADGHRPATVLALPWNLAQTPETGNPVYAMATQSNPWQPDSRGLVFRTVLELAGDMHFTRLDPDRAGEFELADDRRRLIVWQNREGWTDHPGKTFTLALSGKERRLQVWTASGLDRSMEVVGRSSVELSDLEVGRTYMLLIQE